MTNRSQRGRLAQSVERRANNANVVGSIPTLASTLRAETFAIFAIFGLFRESICPVRNTRGAYQQCDVRHTKISSNQSLIG